MGAICNLHIWHWQTASRMSHIALVYSFWRNVEKLKRAKQRNQDDLEWENRAQLVSKTLRIVVQKYLNGEKNARCTFTPPMIRRPFQNNRNQHLEPRTVSIKTAREIYIKIRYISFNRRMNKYWKDLKGCFLFCISSASLQCLNKRVVLTHCHWAQSVILWSET